MSDLSLVFAFDLLLCATPVVTSTDWTIEKRISFEVRQIDLNDKFQANLSTVISLNDENSSLEEFVIYLA